MKNKITGKSLRRDISAYTRLKKASFTQDKYYQKEEILDRAYDILRSYQQNQLSIEPQDYQVFAEYINNFGAHEKEELLDKLQANADFDIRAYLAKKSKTLWQRLFPKTKTIPTLSAAKMKAEMNKYLSLSDKLSHEFSNYGNLVQKLETLQYNSEGNLQAFLDGGLIVDPQDFDVFKKYIKTFNAFISEGDLAFRTLEAVRKQQQEQSSVQTVPQQSAQPQNPVIKPSYFKQKMEKLFTKSKTLWKNTKKKQSAIRLPAFKKETLWHRVKVAAVSAVIVISSAFIFKSGASSQTNKPAKANTTLVVKKPQQTVNNAKTIHVAEFSKPQQFQVKPVAVKPAAQSASVKAESKTVKPAAQNATTKAEDKNAKIWQNYYDTTIDIIAPTVHVNKAELYAQIDNQIRKGVLTLPEGVSKEKVALNYVLFKAYGLQSSLGTALSADKKLSGKQLADFTRDASVKQVDIKQIALKRHGKLSSYSAYNHASKTKKMQHAKNLKELRQMKKQASQHI